MWHSAEPLGPGVGCKQLHLAGAPPTPWGLGALLWLQKGKRGWGGVRFQRPEAGGTVGMGGQR